MADTSSVPNDELTDALFVLADVLEQRRVNYAIIGGIAASFRSQPRFTKDVDFLLVIPQLSLPPLLERLANRGFEFDELTTIREWTQHHMTVLSYKGVRVDWMKPVLPIHQHILDRAAVETWQGRKMRFATVEGLILLKLIAYRPQDVLDIERMVAIHRAKIDLDWIRSEWLTVSTLDNPRMKRLDEIINYAK